MLVCSHLYLSGVPLQLFGNQILRSCCIWQASRSFSLLFLFSKFSEFSSNFLCSASLSHSPEATCHSCWGTCMHWHPKSNFVSKEHTEEEFHWTFIALLYPAPPYAALSCPFFSSLVWVHCSNLQSIFMCYSKHCTKEQIITGLFKLETSKNGQSGKGHLICFLARIRRYLVIFKALQCKSYQREMILYYAEALMHNHRI